MIKSKNVTEKDKIKEFISDGKTNTFNLDNLNIIATNEKSNITYPVQNILRENYRGCILRYCQEIELKGETFEHYKFRPKRLCLDLYGATELWHLILWINNMTSITDFNKEKILVFHPDYLNILTDIYENEYERLYSNRETPITELK